MSRVLPSVVFVGGILLAGGIGAGIVGCDRPKSHERGNASEQTAATSGESAEGTGEESSETPFRVVTSDSLPERPERIVSLAPNVTETLFAIGADDRVVGRTKFCDHPEEATELPSVGSYVNPDFETILAREPDMVIGTISGGQESMTDKLDGAGVSYAFLGMETVDATLRGIATIGDLVGRSDEAEQVVASIRRRIEQTARRYEDRSSPTVLLVHGHDPIVAAGPGTFGSQLVERVGARNVLADGETEYPRLDIEKVLELDPDRIVDTAMKGDADRTFWSTHSELTAVREDRVVYLTDTAVLRPGPRLAVGMKRLGRAVYPSSSESSGAESPSDAGEGAGR